MIRWMTLTNVLKEKLEDAKLLGQTKWTKKEQGDRRKQELLRSILGEVANSGLNIQPESTAKYARVEFVLRAIALDIVYASEEKPKNTHTTVNHRSMTLQPGNNSKALEPQFPRGPKRKASARTRDTRSLLPQRSAQESLQERIDDLRLKQLQNTSRSGLAGDSERRDIPSRENHTARLPRGHVQSMSTNTKLSSTLGPAPT